MIERRSAGDFKHEAAASALSDVARPEAVAAQHARGRRTARERIAALCERFTEVGALARPEEPGPDGQPVPGDGIVTGIGIIDGRSAMVLATDFTAAGGSNGILGNEKQRRCWEIAASRGIPVVMLFDGGGHRIHEGLDARDFAGGFDIHETLSRLSGWVPLVAAFVGPGFGQATLAASMCDYVVAVRGIAAVGMAPPALVKAATGQEVDPDQLFSADAQAAFGTVDLAVDDEADALLALRIYLATVPPNCDASLPHDPHASAPDQSLASTLDARVPDDLRMGYDMRDVIGGIVDCDSEVELKSAFASNLITILATVDGRPLGIIANQPAVQAGALDAPAADKAAHLVSLCDAFGIPILVLMDLPGLAVGIDAEREGLGRSAGRLSLELGAATVPTFTVVARKGFGGGYVILSGGRTYRPELVVAWPHAETGVMSVESAVDLVFRKQVAEAPDSELERQRLVELYSTKLGAIRGAEGFGFDEIIRPSQTRDRLIDVMRSVPRRRLMQTVTPRVHPVQPL